MKPIWLSGAAVLLLALAAFVVVGASPALQDALMMRGLKALTARADRSDLLADNSLHVFLCGTGSPLPDPARANACTAIIAGGHVVVIDAGPGSWARLGRLRVPAGAIDTVLLTHLHSDHIGGLGELAVQSWIGGRTLPLDVFGPGAPDDIATPHDAEGHAYATTGTAAVVEGFARAYDADSGFRIVHHGADYLAPEGARMVAHEITKPAPDRLVPVFDRDGLKISAFLVNHHPVEPAFGYRIEYRGRVAVVSGDTKKTESMVRFSTGADLLVHEALNREMVSMISEALARSGDRRLAKMLHDTIDYHTTPVEAAGIAREAGVRLLVLTHIVPPLPNLLARHIFMRGVADARGSGHTLLGYDGLMISLPAGSSDIVTSNID